MLLFFKRLAKSNGYIYFFLLNIYNNYNRFISKLKTEIILHSNTCKIQYDIIGKKNKIIIGKDTIINKLTIHIRGNNNILDIGNKCFFGENCLIWMEGDNCEIKIGDHTTSTRDNEFNAQEYKSKITIGNDCMISNNVTIRTSDSHPYFDIQSGTRLNIPQNINIGNHVWIAPNTKIMKGAIIKDGAIIGSDTTISKEIPTNSLAIGRPAKIIRTNIRWSREALF